MTNSPSTVRPLSLANADLALRHVFVNNLRLDAEIGIHPHEQNVKQPVIVSVDLTVTEQAAPVGDQIDSVLCYEGIVNIVHRVIDQGHINLVETMAEQIANACLVDERVQSTRVRVEKPAAFAAADSVGVEIERKRR
ncbi:MAG: dihydroneopterin aldolase [Alphaproteobacteria bacterium]